MLAKPYDFLFKLVLVGDMGVGKTSVLARYAEDTFTITSTLGSPVVDFKIKTIELEGRRIKLQLWDVNEPERYWSILAAYYRLAMGVIIVCDITNVSSFDNITKYLQQIVENAAPDVEQLLIGNKCDLEEGREVPKQSGELFAQNWNIPFLETSAKSGHNINKGFEQMAGVILRKVSHKEEKVVADHLQDNHEGTKPTLPELLRFTCTDGRVINIPVKIATKYIKFGNFLLDDRTGSRVKFMARKHLNDPEEINTEVLQEWLTGRGKQPVTWATLVEVLHDVELSALAGEIEAAKCPAGAV